MEPRLITFDCYGTLIDWYGGLRDALASLGVPEEERNGLAARYVEIEAEIEQGPFLPYREVMARGLGRMMEERGTPLPADRRDLLAASLPRWRVFPEVTEILRSLARKVPLAILSNIDDDLLEASVRALDAPISHRVTAQQVGSYKPAHGHFRRILEITGLGAGEILHVAQSLHHDHQPCREIGIPSLWINRNGEPRPPWLEAGRELADLRTLPERAGLR